jgi:hypothetical protein
VKKTQSRAAVAKTRVQFWNSEEEERPPLEASTRVLVKAVIEETSVCVTIKCKSVVSNFVFKESNTCSYLSKNSDIVTRTRDSMLELHTNIRKTGNLSLMA